MRLWCLFGVLLCSCLLSGCGGDGINRVPIEGTLTSQGTDPVDSAVLVFDPQEGTAGEGAIGRTDAEGKFTVISSRDDDSGIPPGKYSVRVSRLVDGQSGEPLPADAPEADFPGAYDSIPAPYSSTKSPLEVDISEQGGELKVDIPVKLKGKR